MDINDIISAPDPNTTLPPKIREARDMFNYAAIFFGIAAIIYVLWGIWDIFRGIFWSSFWFSGYYGTLQIFYGIVRIVLGVIAFVIKGKFIENIINPIDQGRYKESEDNMILYIILGLIFGLVISGILIILGYMKFQEIDTQANKCPTCGAPLRYIAEYDRHYCDNCGDYKVPVHPPEPSPPQSQQQNQQYQQPQSQPYQQTGQQYQQGSEQQYQIQESSQHAPNKPAEEESKKTCPTCGNEARWIKEYERYYCDNCQKYL
ncbi:MAG: hypothetical protein ACLFVB_03540 [Thermoplasmata archaeon]